MSYVERIGFGPCQYWRNICVLFAVVLEGSLGGLGYVCVCCESGLFELMAGPGICILC